MFIYTLSRFIIVCGHYGCGKTNFSLNLASDLAKKGGKVTLIDLDIVNPYFRSSDYGPLLEAKGIRLIAPVFAHSNVDIPSLPTEIYSVFTQKEGIVIFDVGGDDAGATALGRFSAHIRAIPDYRMLYLINKYRPLTTDSCEAVGLLHEIEAASRLRATEVVNNSHLQGLTAEEDILSALPYAEETAKKLNLPLSMTTAPRALAEKLTDRVKNLYPIDIYVKPPWVE